MKPIVISMGDAAGIGPEIILKGLGRAPAQARGCVVLGDLAAMRRAKALPGLAELPLALAQLTALDQVDLIPPGCLGVLQACQLPRLPAWGQVSGDAGRAAGQCISAGARAVLSGQARALVTAPIHKEALSAAGPPWSEFPGHTELLQDEAARFLGCPVDALPVRMMLVSPQLRTILVSIHVSLRQALDLVTTQRVLQTLQVAHTALHRALGRAPSLAVAGLNPHAGEGGLFGREELEVIAPAVAMARQAGIDASGPHPPDTVFMRARSGQFDAVIAMYHDQGLIPVKYLGLEEGVNVTLGLPLLRTSPDHGTAFDIAGTGSADPTSLLAALALARQWSEPPGA
ncbi:MAG: 4-hydroxythreonine-4-phosphate dehydrogenase PdxA [Comamonadaceae bacterium]|jgi:4-hydroxythreonine-4-phosphate dehydrogenase|nr:4-hydroxythreonine-4-phosphate dehydrogenase PdxA [Comamonadaceae bacterium]